MQCIDVGEDRVIQLNRSLSAHQLRESRCRWCRALNLIGRGDSGACSEQHARHTSKSTVKASGIDASSVLGRRGCLRHREEARPLECGEAFQHAAAQNFGGDRLKTLKILDSEPLRLD